MRSLKEKVLRERIKGLALSLGKEKEQQRSKRKTRRGYVTEPRKEKISRRMCLAMSNAVKASTERRAEERGLAIQGLWETLTKGFQCRVGNGS